MYSFPVNIRSDNVLEAQDRKVTEEMIRCLGLLRNDSLRGGGDGKWGGGRGWGHKGVKVRLRQELKFTEVG